MRKTFYYILNTTSFTTRKITPAYLNVSCQPGLLKPETMRVRRIKKTNILDTNLLNSLRVIKSSRLGEKQMKDIVFNLMFTPSI